MALSRRQALLDVLMGKPGLAKPGADPEGPGDPSPEEPETEIQAATKRPTIPKPKLHAPVRTHLPRGIR